MHLPSGEALRPFGRAERYHLLIPLMMPLMISLTIPLVIPVMIPLDRILASRRGLAQKLQSPLRPDEFESPSRVIDRTATPAQIQPLVLQDLKSGVEEKASHAGFGAFPSPG